jgi:hypothetical protein
MRNVQQHSREKMMMLLITWELMRVEIYYSLARFRNSWQGFKIVLCIFLYFVALGVKVKEVNLL